MINISQNQVVDKFMTRCNDCGRSFELHGMNDVYSYGILAQRHHSRHNHECIVEKKTMHFRNGNIVFEESPETVALFTNLN